MLSLCSVTLWLHDTPMTFIVQHRCRYPGFGLTKADEPQIPEQGRQQEVLLAASLHAALPRLLLGDTGKTSAVLCHGGQAL